MSETNKLTVSASPHIKDNTCVRHIMFDVLIALVPAAFGSVMIFGMRAAVVIAVCIISCVIFEYLTQKIMKRKTTVGDLSAVVTGLLLSLSLPVSVPVWLCVLGSFIAIIAAKQLFGGIGHNLTNPAITARIVLFLLFTKIMTDFSLPDSSSLDTVSCATPLAQLSSINLENDLSQQLHSLIAKNELPTLLQMFFGAKTGSIGEVCSIALLLGAVYLFARGIIKPATPLAYLLSFITVVLVISKGNLFFALYELLGGSLLLGAFFMATDYATSPINTKGKIIFGIGCGVITAVLRLFTPLHEGVMFAIFIMNLATPLIEKLTIKTKKMTRTKCSQPSENNITKTSKKLAFTVKKKRKKAVLIGCEGCPRAEICENSTGRK